MNLTLNIALKGLFLNFCPVVWEHHRMEIIECQCVELLGKDGKKVYADMKVSPITDAEGNYLGTIAAVKDVTAQTIYENALEEKETMLKQILELIPPQLFDKDGKGKFLFSESYEKLTRLEGVVNQLKDKSDE